MHTPSSGRKGGVWMSTWNDINSEFASLPPDSHKHGEATKAGTLVPCILSSSWGRRGARGQKVSGCA